MGIVDKHRTFVKEQISFQERMARRYSSEPWRRDLHMGNVTKLLELISDMEKIERELDRQSNELAKAVPTQKSMTVAPGDREGLPDEVLQERGICDGGTQKIVT